MSGGEGEEEGEARAAAGSGQGREWRQRRCGVGEATGARTEGSFIFPMKIGDRGFCGWELRATWLNVGIPDDMAGGRGVGST